MKGIKDMKKVILVLIISLFLTGCTANYNIKLDDIIEEEIVIDIPDSLSNTVKKDIDDQLKNLTAVIDVYEKGHEYQITNKKIDIGTRKTLSYKYDNDKYQESVLGKRCFKNFMFKETNEYYSIKASGLFGCLYENEKVNINIKTSKFVSKENSNTKKDNVYTWTINNENKENTNIDILVMKNIKETKSSFGETFKKIFSATVVLSMLIGGIYLFKNMK
ncbi:MAG: hypothetical protein RSE21_03010 [Bacilli bacterium]